MRYSLSHLRQLEAESIYIMREVFAESENPVMLYSVGKDSSVMLRLAQKAFCPGTIPFPLLHVDTTLKFREMIGFRDRMAREVGFRLEVYTNDDALAQGCEPCGYGTQNCCALLKTQALLDALRKGGYDAAFGGARRDEERSRAKERVFSFRDRFGQWDPKDQRPELWNIYNSRVNPGESIRVFPLSNWTEADIWHYIYVEQIPIVPLYFARDRDVFEKDGMLLLSDGRFPLPDGVTPKRMKVRFRTLGCVPCTGAIESDADTIEKVILEVLSATHSERHGRAIDHDREGSMEKKKREGYF